METALRLMSRRGIMCVEVKATNVRSYADARHLGPFLDVEGNPVYWKGWSTKRTSRGRKRVAHFCKYPFGRIKGKVKQIELEDSPISRSNSESKVHKKARIELANNLRSQLESGAVINWAYKDEETSDFTFSGNILEGVERVETNYKYLVSEFDLEFEYDVVLLGPTIGQEPIIMAAIEIEKSNRFEQIKLLASRCLAFPLMSINIEGHSEDDINEEWCQKAVSETKKNSADELRRNYVYLHDMLVPFYLDIPWNLQPDGKHAFLIFVKPEGIERLQGYLRGYQRRLGFENQKVVHIDNVKLNSDNADSVKMFENEGSMAGAQWSDYNDRQYIRVTISTDNKKRGNLLVFSHILARLVNTYADAIVGYKLAKGIKNNEKDNPYWFSSDGRKIAPKTLSEPIVPVLEHYKKWGIIDQIKKSQSG